MKTIAIRQFQRHFYSELKSVPFIVTRQNPKTKEEKMEFIIFPYDPESPIVKFIKNQELKEQHLKAGDPESVNVPMVVVESVNEKETISSRIAKIFKK